VRAVDDELGRGDFDVLVSSFDPRLLLRLKARRPDARLAMLTTHERRWSLPLARRLARSLFAVHVDREQVTDALITELLARTRVGVWTVNDADEMSRLQRLGVDWIITDDVGAHGR
jgi:glycerophosphoryl diester phosphodiesterase